MSATQPADKSALSSFSLVKPLGHMILRARERRKPLSLSLPRQMLTSLSKFFGMYDQNFTLYFYTLFCPYANLSCMNSVDGVISLTV